MTLYRADGCPYCHRVERAAEDLGIELTQADIGRDEVARAALMSARGRLTVPVLRIEEEGEVRWMPESADIVRYLYRRFGDGRRPPWTQHITPARVVLAVMLLLWLVQR